MVACIVAISGKRKSGKDYCARILRKELERRNVAVTVTGISHRLKALFASRHGLDYEELLTDGPYKEKYRAEMIKWGEDARSRDPGVFCRHAIEQHQASDVIIISDCRRKTDYSFFVEKFSTLTVRIEASDEDRRKRGFQFVEGVDDAESECGLDDYGNFDVHLQNRTGDDIRAQIDAIADKIEDTVKNFEKNKNKKL